MIKCIYCSSQNILTVGKVVANNKAYNDKTYLVQCENCNIYWIHPFPDMEKLSEIYGEEYHFGRSKLRDWFVQLYVNQELISDSSIVDGFKSKGKILDVGAGRGDFLSKFQTDKWERWAHDPYFSEKEIAVLKKRIGENVQSFSTLKKYPSDFFDVVILRNVLEHTTKFSDILKQVNRVLKKGGIVFIRTPNMKSLDFHFFRTNWYSIIMPGHIVFYDPDSMDRILKDHKFKILYNKPLAISGPLALSRSMPIKMNIVMLYLLTFVYSAFSYFFKRGGDFRVIAKK